MEINLPFSSCPLHSLTDLTRDLVTSDSFFFKISELKGPDSVGVDKRQEDTTTKSAGYHVRVAAVQFWIIIHGPAFDGGKTQREAGLATPTRPGDQVVFTNHWSRQITFFETLTLLEMSFICKSFLILYKALKSVMVGFDSNPLSYKGKTEASAQLSEI